MTRINATVTDQAKSETHEVYHWNTVAAAIVAFWSPSRRYAYEVIDLAFPILEGKYGR